MSKTETDLPERLSTAGALPLEQRLLRAAGSELPSAELSARMAQAIGVSLPAAGLAAASGSSARTAAAASKVTSAAALVPWVSGAVAAAIAAGTFFATRPSATPAEPTRVTGAAIAAASAPTSAATPVVPLATAPAKSLEDRAAQALTASPVAAPRNRGAPTTNDLAAQIALVDTARAALASGAATRALASVRDYQSDYPNGAFRPEVAAIKIEALMKLARRSEARALAERFRASYGPGPLADRVSRLVGAPQP